MSTTISKPAEAARSRGRPREFDLDSALDKAVRVFCERGYQATSIHDLTEAMQLASGSVYKAFGDKRGVFLAALERYKAVRDARLRAACAKGRTGAERLRKALAFYAESSHGEDGRLGCMVAGGAAQLPVLDAAAAQWVAGAFERNERFLAELIGQGQADGSIPAQVDCAATARMLLCLIQGMRLVGKTGRTRKQMERVADIAMKVLT